MSYTLIQVLSLLVDLRGGEAYLEEWGVGYESDKTPILILLSRDGCEKYRVLRFVESREVSDSVRENVEPLKDIETRSEYT
jgi:hypothetical protein